MELFQQCVILFFVLLNISGMNIMLLYTLLFFYRKLINRKHRLPAIFFADIEIKKGSKWKITWGQIKEKWRKITKMKTNQYRVNRQSRNTCIDRLLRSRVLCQICVVMIYVFRECLCFLLLFWLMFQHTPLAFIVAGSSGSKLIVGLFRLGTKLTN